MKEYLDIVERVMTEGEMRGNRTDQRAKSVFKDNFTHDLRDGFPLMTHKKMGIMTITAELLWFMSGRTDLQYLEELKAATIWDDWADDEGRLGPIYGEQWRRDTDQLATVIDKIRNNPTSRRLLVVAWNPDVLPDESIPPHENPAQGKQALPPCHFSFQFYVSNDGVLSLDVNMRSNDVMLGLPFNIASYAILAHIVAFMTGTKVGMLHLDTGDTHIYENHITSGGAGTALSRKEDLFELPTLDLQLDDCFKLTDDSNVSEVLDQLRDVEVARKILKQVKAGLTGYQSHPKISMDVAV